MTNITARPGQMNGGLAIHLDNLTAHLVSDYPKIVHGTLIPFGNDKGFKRQCSAFLNTNTWVFCFEQLTKNAI